MKFKQLALDFKRCFVCDWPIQIKTHDDEMGVRCTKCGSSAVTQSLSKAFKSLDFETEKLKIYELSSRGAWVKYLNSTSHDITLSEFYDDIEPGQCTNGIYSQNVEQLTFEDESFDLCTSLEVFEHVQNDRKGFIEIHRVLKPNGTILFTVPINLAENTIERTEIIDGKQENILPPEFHSDSLRGINKVFCYRNYGIDIISSLEKAGFKNCKIIEPNQDELFGLGRPVICGQK